MVEGAAVGGVLGGVTGYLIGGNATSTAIGAGAGAVAGGIGGYYVARQKAAGNQNALTNAVFSDLSTENKKIDGVERRLPPPRPMPGARGGRSAAQIPRA